MVVRTCRATLRPPNNQRMEKWRAAGGSWSEITGQLALGPISVRSVKAFNATPVDPGQLFLEAVESSST